MEVTADQFREWLERAKPGARIVYHTGHLCADREEWVWIDELGHAAWEAFQAKKAHLVQKRVERNVFYYVAVKR